MPTLVINTTQLDPLLISEFEKDLGTSPVIDDHSTRFKIRDTSKVAGLKQLLPFDINVLPDGFDPAAVKLVVSDMDSTLINIECIDEIADHVGLKDQVSAVTEAAMSGQLDFRQSLRKRVGLLKGLSADSLNQVYNERLQINPGGELMLRTLQRNNIQFSLVSGGFHFFTDRLMARYGFNDTLANNLGMHRGKLTGKVDGPIIDATAKADYLLGRCKKLGIEPNQAVAIGDGANDLEMMAVAGLGIAYRAKPTVQQQADCSLNFSGLEGLLILLGLPY